MIFLDSAATTLQKPSSVGKAMGRALHRCASPGRGGYAAAEAAAQTVYRCRETAARLFHMEDPSRVVLTSSATHSLNIALRTLAQEGGRVVISGYEHNAVTRTLAALPVEVEVMQGTLFRPEELVDSFRRSLPGASFAVCTQVSNVFGYRLPLEEIANLCREQDVPLVVDASQGAGCLMVDMDALGAEYVAMPGHKGLYGPQGTGLLLCAASAHPLPLLTGGTGSESILQEMPDFLPDRLEAGTHNVPGAAGLLAGLEFVEHTGPERILHHEQRLRRSMAQALRHLPGVELFEAEDPRLQTGVLSLVAQGADCEELGQRLGQMGVCVRSGLHCAPLAHASAGTLDTGTLRLSFSAFNKETDVSMAAAAMKRALGACGRI